ncbi:transcription termination/antitermination NusG family protein [Bosea thiooxidans]
MVASSAAGAHWYVVQTRHLCEMRAAQELANQGFEVFLPRYLRKRRHARKVSFAPAPLFPGYLFVSLDPARQRWRSINGTFGVVRVIAGEDGPVPVAGGVVGGLKARADAQGLIAMSQRPSFVPGEIIRIRSGSFVETLGLFEGFRDQDRVAVLLELLGGQVRVVLGEELVEKAA